MKVSAGARSNTTADTFDKFRHDSYLNEKALTEKKNRPNVFHQKVFKVTFRLVRT